MNGVFIETPTERSVGCLTRHGPDLSLDDMISIWWVDGKNDDGEFNILEFVYRGVAHGIPDYIRSQKVVAIVSVDDLPMGIHVPETDRCIFIEPTDPDIFKRHIERWNDMSDMGGLTI